MKVVTEGARMAKIIPQGFPTSEEVMGGRLLPIQILC
jgi:hypothetical protein